MKDFHRFHSENGVRTVKGSIGPVSDSEFWFRGDSLGLSFCSVSWLLIIFLPCSKFQSGCC